MNYATWKLNFSNPDYGTGPESTISALGSHAEGGFSTSAIEQGGLIVGYVDSVLDTSNLSAWDFAYTTEAEALSLAIEVNPLAYLGDDGRIGFPMPGEL